MRQKLINLVDDLHWQCARWLTSNYRVILLPKFETQSMTRRGERQIQSKTARDDAELPTLWVQETSPVEGLAAGVSRFRSQRGVHQPDPQLGRESGRGSWAGRETIRDESGFIMDRDINGARGIFLRALGDSPFLRELLTRVASPQTSTLLNIC